MARRKGPKCSPDQKWCWKCNRVKNRESEFWKDRRSHDGLQAKCKDCCRQHLKDFHKKHPKKNDEYRENFYESIGGKQNRYQTYKDSMLAQSRRYKRTMEGITSTLLESAKGRAKKSRHECLLTLEWVREQWKKQEGRCALTGIPFQLDSERIGAYRPFAPSLDKIDPKKGYTEENTRLVCVAINLALNQFGEETFTLIACAYLHELNRKGT
jgi:hypothetical protein